MLALGTCLIVAACSGGFSVGRDRGDLRIVYDHIESAHKPAVQLIRDARVLERAAHDINARLKLRHSTFIEVTDDLPAEVNSPEYLPANRTIFIPASFIAEVQRHLALPESAALLPAGGPSGDEVTIGTVEFVMSHEIGHALIQQMLLDIPGGEQATEQAADQFAALQAMSEGNGAVPTYSSIAFLHLDGVPRQDAKQQRTFAGDHSLTQGRFEQLDCWILGSNPDGLRAAIVGKVPVTEDLAGCPSEWATAVARWTRLLRPFLKPGAPPPGMPAR